MRLSARIVAGVRIGYGLFWLLLALGPLVANAPFPRQPTAEANAFWDAIAATGLMIPLTGATYFVGGVFCLRHRTTPLGLAFLSAPLGVIVPFNVLLVRQPGPWILIVIVHLALMLGYWRAYEPLWSYEARIGQGGERPRNVVPV